MRHTNSIIIPTFAGLLLAVKAMGVPTSVGGDTFTLVATNSGATQLYSLAADDAGVVYAGNNSYAFTVTPDIPVQRFRPASFAGSAVQFETIGPVCSDCDGLAFGAGYLYAADCFAGTRKISVTNGSASIFSTLTTSFCGSPLAFRASDGHLFSNVGCQTNKIREFDSAGNIVANHTTTNGVQTMAFDPASGIIYYANYPSGDVRAYDPISRADSFLATIDGSIDGGLAVDRLSNRLFVGTANGANQGRVYTIDLTTHAVSLFASGFDGSLGILREQISGDLYFLEAHNLYRLQSTNVVFSPKLFIWPAVELGWLSDTNQRYQVQWATELDTNTWTNFEPAMQGNGTTNFLFDTTRDSLRRFYRVVVTN
jgi:hypothetical protein